jgi:DNA polymerase
VAEHAQPAAVEPEQELLQIARATRSRLRKLQESGVTGVPRARSTPRAGGGRYDFPGAYGAAASTDSVAVHVDPPPMAEGSPGAAALAAIAGPVVRPPVPVPAPASVAAPPRPPQTPVARPPASPAGRPFALVETAYAELPPPGVLRGSEGLTELRRLLGDCQRCKLCHGRNHVVFADGSPDAWLAFVGEGPGADEDRLGRPFVGAAGQLLDRMIDAMAGEAKRRGHSALVAHLSRPAVYIANVVKCRPPGNRTPEPDEMAACSPFLRRQLAALPSLRAIVALGRTPTQYLLRSTAPISGLRGQFAQWEGIPVMPTYHPAYLLRTPSAKRQVWEDLQRVIDALASTLSTGERPPAP